ncbi:40S ribosomal protein S11 [Takifugu flavidus]|uniref:Small ribosomal subunit protein uS17 n=1 Tax=Takifugu flavidus TaxID=433684 RepID=A0A5C6NUH7_9TELE|nr:40S ribosomal protein S11 [Takifugu flavidus]
MADAQTERSYQKQPTIFQNKKRVLATDGGKEAKEKLPRYHKSVGLGFKTPREAIEGTYIDKKCPFTGNVSIRGRILSGVVTKMKMQRTIVIRRDYLHYIRKYNRFEKRHKNMSVHLSPCFSSAIPVAKPTFSFCRDVTVGDIVTVGECRPLSKTVRFNVLKVTKAAGAKKQFQKF